jgi:hypothetical protein
MDKQDKTTGTVPDVGRKRDLLAAVTNDSSRDGSSVTTMMIDWLNQIESDINSIKTERDQRNIHTVSTINALRDSIADLDRIVGEYTSRLANVEETSMKIVHYLTGAFGEGGIVKRLESIESTIKQVIPDFKETFEERLRMCERKIWIWAGALMVITFALPFIIKHVL